VIISEGRQSSSRRAQLPHTGLRSSHRVWRALHVRLHGDGRRELGDAWGCLFLCLCVCACLQHGTLQQGTGRWERTSLGGTSVHVSMYVSSISACWARCTYLSSAGAHYAAGVSRRPLAHLASDRSECHQASCLSVSGSALHRTHDAVGIVLLYRDEAAGSAASV
jgi:hypothetical protein